jgi:hypothetical protein
MKRIHDEDIHPPQSLFLPLPLILFLFQYHSLFLLLLLLPHPNPHNPPAVGKSPPRERRRKHIQRATAAGSVGW